jgi:alkylhydroperoxidase family enzyme
MVDAIPNADGSTLFTEEEKALITGSTELSRMAKLSDAMFARLRRFFDERALVDLVVNTSIANMNNRITDSFIADLEP